MPMADIALLAIIGASALFGFMRGFVGTLASIVAWVLAGYLAFRFGAETAFWLSDDGMPTAGELLAGYALSFVMVLVFVGLVGWAVKSLVHSVGLSGLDRLLGLALGLLRGVFIACVIVLLLGFTDLPEQPGWGKSRVLAWLQPGAEYLAGWLPEWAADEVDFGNRPPRGDNDALMALPVPLIEEAAKRVLGPGTDVQGGQTDEQRIVEQPDPEQSDPDGQDGPQAQQL